MANGVARVSLVVLGAGAEIGAPGCGNGRAICHVIRVMSLRISGHFLAGNCLTILYWLDAQLPQLRL